ncbi:AAA family ATPase [Paraburkholderia sp. DHOC27]|uniref:ATP-binding protein n=1 Tax=Paraburkholderia sp. DHOC27 TaxID=2303330 RepID=UPI000E3E5BD2|nr:AAA family ATPase [Paraburkholderia sp. DHOC27]RFU44406.1 hypothetical protein D0B32_27725 [Paraburkholderia sp. DHOC27]
MNAVPGTRSSYRFADFRLDTTNECLWRERSGATPERIDLARKTFAVLRQLLENRHLLITHDALLEAVWPNVHVQHEVVKAQIRMIRALLDDNAKQPRFIETVRGRGYRFIAPLQLHAIKKPVDASDPCATRFVGRAREMAQLAAAMKQVRSGTSQLVVVTGEPGIGKSALLKAFSTAEISGPDDAWLAEGSCIEGYGGREPYYPVLQALKHLCEGHRGSEVLRALITIAPTWALELPGQITNDDREVMQRQIVGASRERMLREICGLLSSITQTQPLVLIFEDVHWADYSTVDLLAAIARQLRTLRLMVIVTYRPDEAAMAHHPIEDLSRELFLRDLCLCLALDPLTVEAVRTLLSESDSSDPVEEELAYLIAQRCSGNPLFMRAIFADLVERNMLRKTATGWRASVSLTEIAEVAPRSIMQTLEGRIRRLGNDERNLLETASVAGARFSGAIAAGPANLSMERFDDLCGQLARNQYFIQDCGAGRLPDDSAVAQYRFDHALVRTAFYDRQGLTRRARLHRQIAERIEAIYPADQRQDVAYELGQHFAEARDWLKAIDNLSIALQTARVRFAYRDSQLILDLAMSLCEKLPAELRAVKRIEFAGTRAALYSAAYDPRAEAAWAELERQASALGLPDVRLRAMLGLAHVLGRSDREHCVEVLDNVLALCASNTDARVSAYVRVCASVRRLWASGWSNEDLARCEAAIDSLRTMGDPLVMAEANMEYSIVCVISTRYREALEIARINYGVLFEHAVQYPGFDLARSTWMMRLGTPWSQLYLGDIGDAIASFDHGIASFRDNGDYFSARTLEVYRGWLLVHTMDYELIIEMYDRFVPVVDVVAEDAELDPGALLPAQHQTCIVLAGLAYIGVGDGKRAESLLAEAERQMNLKPTIFDWYWRLAIEWGAVEAAMLNKDHQSASLRTQALLKLALATEDRTWQAFAWEVAAREANQRDDPRTALESINAAFRVADGFDTPLADWRLHRTAVAIYRALSDTEQAELHQHYLASTLGQLTDSLPRDAELGQRLRAIGDS